MPDEFGWPTGGSLTIQNEMSSFQFYRWRVSFTRADRGGLPPEFQERIGRRRSVATGLGPEKNSSMFFRSTFNWRAVSDSRNS